MINDKFVLYFGGETDKSKRDMSGNVSAGTKQDVGVKFKVSEDAEITVKGFVEFNIEVEINIDFGLIKGLKSYKIITKNTNTKGIEINFSGKFPFVKEEKSLFSIPLGTQPINAVPPLWLTESIDFKVAFEGSLEGSISAKASVTSTSIGGIIDNGSTVEPVKNYERSTDIPEFKVSGKVYAKPSIKLEPKVMLCDVVGIKLSGEGGIKIERGLESNFKDLSYFTKLSFFLKAEMGIDIIDTDIPPINKMIDKLKNLVFILYEKEWAVKAEIDIIQEKKNSLYIEVSGESKNYSIKSTEKGNLPDVLGTYVLQNTGDESLEWEIKKSGNLFDYAWIDITPKGKLEPQGSITAKIVWKSGVSKQSLGSGTFNGRLDFINKSKQDLPDSQTGSTARSIKISIEASPITPTPQNNTIKIYQNPDSGILVAGRTLTQYGTGCTPNSKVTLYVMHNNQVTSPPPGQFPVDSSGIFNAPYNSEPTKEPGEYTWWVVDNSSDVKSSELTYTVIRQETRQPKVQQEADTVMIGRSLMQKGSGFTPGGTATIQVRKPDGSLIERADIAQVDANGDFETTYKPEPDKKPGVYTWWAIDNSSGTKSINELSYTVTKKEDKPSSDTGIKKPDLVVESVWLSDHRTSFSPKEKVKIFAKIKNQGDADVDIDSEDKVTVRYYLAKGEKNQEDDRKKIDDEKIKGKNLKKGDDPKEESVDNFKMPDKPGRFNISVMVDVKKIVDESDEGNNWSAVLKFDVVEGKPTDNTGQGETPTNEEPGSSKIVVFPDKNLEAVIRQAINKPTGDIFASDLLGLTSLYGSQYAHEKEIVSIEGLQYCTNLTVLYLENNQISDIHILSSLINLTELGMWNNRISDITHLSGLKRLTKLDLNDNQISDISVLGGLKNLISLSLSGNQISNISMLSGLKSLTALSLPNNPISDFSAVTGLTNLNHLDLSTTNFSDIKLLSALTNLRFLYLFNNQISDLSAVTGLKNLEMLFLNKNRISDISVLAELTKLTHLELGFNLISNISDLAGLSDLTSLVLYRNKISDITVLSGLTNLNWLFLEGNQISDIKPLIDNTGISSGDYVTLYSQDDQSSNPLSTTSCTVYIPQLQSRGVNVVYSCLPNVVVSFPDGNLDTVIRQAINKPSGDIMISDVQGLTDLNATEKGIVNIEGIQYCNNLTKLDLNFNQISDINALAGLINLTNLYLFNNQVSNIGVLAGLKNLKELELGRNQFSDISILKGLTNLTLLSISGSQLRDIRSLEGLNNLIKLNLSNNDINNISVIVSLTKLTSLNLDSNKIIDINVLSGLKNLTSLSIANNQISSISSLSGLNNLNYLSLSGNNIADIKPLIDNVGINSGDSVWLYSQGSSNPLSTNSCTDYIPQLKSRGVNVSHNCPQ